MKRDSVTTKLIERGISNKILLEAFKDIPEEFVRSETLLPYFYEGVRVEKSIENLEPRAIIIARMLEQLDVKHDENILITGVDSIFVLVALSKIYKNVYTVETNDMYAKWTQEVLNSEKITNVKVAVGQPEQGWLEKVDFDTILIAAEIEEISDSLKNQLKIGGKLLAPIGPDWAHVILELTERISESDFKITILRDKYFIPKPANIPFINNEKIPEKEIVHEIGLNSDPFNAIKKYPFEKLLNRIGNAKIVLLGEASHGTSEFYLMRQEITKHLIEKKGFNFVCAEADWSDAEQINNYVRNDYKQQGWMPFGRFPQWMWKNKEVLDFVEWLRNYNKLHQNTIGFYGLDLYGLQNSIDLVIKYLEAVNKDMAALAKERYACITPFMKDPATYGKLVLHKMLKSCEKEVLHMLFDILKYKDRLNHSREYLYAYQNSTVVVDAERYYKAMYYGNAESWNLRDFHMFSTLRSLLSYYGNNAKAVIWAHNSHIGNALATEMYSRGEINIGHLCKEQYGVYTYHIGFGTHTGTVAAANNWGEPMKVMNVNDSLEGSYEHLCHQTNWQNFSLNLQKLVAEERLREVLSIPKLERAIGVIYRPQTELASHYFSAVLPSQFDEYIYFNSTNAVTPIKAEEVKPKLLEVHPFGYIDE